MTHPPARRELQTIRRATDSQPATIQHVRVDHSRAQIGVAEELLNRANVGPGFQQMSRE